MQKWLAPVHLCHFKTPEKGSAGRAVVFRVMLVCYLVDTKMINIYIANYTVLTNTLRERPLPSNPWALRPLPCVGHCICLGSGEFSGEPWWSLNCSSSWILVQHCIKNTTYTIDRMARGQFLREQGIYSPPHIFHTCPRWWSSWYPRLEGFNVQHLCLTSTNLNFKSVTIPKAQNGIITVLGSGKQRYCCKSFSTNYRRKMKSKWHLRQKNTESILSQLV